jgi:carbonic anhydrase
MIGAAAAGLATLGAGRAFAQSTPQNAITPEEALKRIMDGNARYAANNTEENDFGATRVQNALGQWPVAGIVSCADSRVAPELLFDQGPGDLFVVRVAGNIVNADGIASLEFGVASLGMPLIMVLGHTSCGAIEAAINTVQDKSVLPGHLPQLTEAIRPAVLKARMDSPDDMVAATTKTNVLYGMQGVRLGSAIIADAIAAGKVAVVGGVYDLADGKVTPVEPA